MNIIALALATSLAAPVPAEKPKPHLTNGGIVVVINAAEKGCGLTPPKGYREEATASALRESQFTAEFYASVIAKASEIFLMDITKAGKLPDFCKRMAKAYEGMK